MSETKYGRASRAMRAASLKVVIFLACGLVLLSVGYARFGIAPSLAQLDVRSLASLPDAERLPRLRELGEQLTRTYSGTSGMGTARARARLRSTDWSALAHACDGASPTGKRVLVTGAAGFIGMHVAQRLRARGDLVVGLDNFNDYYPVALKRARGLSLESLGVPVLEADVADEALLRRLMNACRFSHVVHLAAQAGVRYAARNPQSYVHANVAGQVSLFEAVAAAPEPRPAVVYASSSSVYGLNEEHPFSESHAVDRPASLYAATKRADELMAHVYWSVHGLSVTGLRFFTVYGPWGRPDMAAFSFAVSACLRRPIRIFQGPERSELSRDFTYIDDIAVGVVASMDAAPPSTKEQARYEVFNLGNTAPHTVSELVDALDAALGTPAVRDMVPMPRQGDVLATFANISKAAAQLGYKPTVDLRTGVGRFAGWFRAYYGSAALPRDEDEKPKRKQAPPSDWDYIPL